MFAIIDEVDPVTTGHGLMSDPNAVLGLAIVSSILYSLHSHNAVIGSDFTKSVQYALLHGEV